MCGILGQINFKNKRIDKIEFNAALELQKHRGPDSGDIYFSNNFAFGIGVFQLLI